MSNLSSSVIAEMSIPCVGIRLKPFQIPNRAGRGFCAAGAEGAVATGGGKDL
jgi:hypothetical protein